MSEDEGGPTIEINPPPKSIVIEAPSSTNQPAMLTGGFNQSAPSNIMGVPPENVKFVMGPGGQLIAMEKPPFLWKDFWIGGGIPFALFFIPLLIVLIGEGLGYGESGYEEIELIQNESGTGYEGQFILGGDEYLESCNVYNPESDNRPDFRCSPSGDREAIIYSYSSGQYSEEVGYWNGNNGTVYFNSSIDYGDKLKLEYSYFSEDVTYQFFDIFQELLGFTCCLGFILSIILLIVGFSQGKPGMGWGGVTALLSLPLVSILAMVTI